MAASTARRMPISPRRCRLILRRSPAVRFFTIHSCDDRPYIRAATMKTLLDHLTAGKILPLIHDRLPLCEAARARVSRKRPGYRQAAAETAKIDPSQGGGWRAPLPIHT